MQTFLIGGFEETAKCLDFRRLGKQRLEAFVLLDLMCNPDKKGWRNHPAFKMWDGYDIALIRYGLCMCEEWTGRGYKDTLGDRFEKILMNYPPYGNVKIPKWVYDERVWISHKSNLKRKDRSYYGAFWPEVPDNLPYFWPSKELDNPINV